MSNGDAQDSLTDLIRRRKTQIRRAGYDTKLQLPSTQKAQVLPEPITGLVQRRVDQDRVRIQAAIALSAARNPEREARVQRLSRRTAIPTDIVRTNLEKFENDLRYSNVDVDTLIDRSPRLARFMAEDRGVEVDDIANMQGLEWTFKSMLGALNYGWQQSVYGARAFAQMNKIPGFAGEENERRLQELENHVLRRYFGDESFLESAWVEWWKMVPMMLTGAGVGAGAALVAGQLGPQAGTPEEVITVPGAAIRGAFAYTFLVESGFAYRELKEMQDRDGVSLDPRLVYGLASSVGAANAAFEVVGLGKAIKAFPGGRQVMERMGLVAMKDAMKRRTFRAALTQFGKDYGGALLYEPATEIAQEITPILARVAAKKIQDGRWDPENWEQNALEVWEVGLKTFEAMALGGAFMSGPKLYIDTRDAGRVGRSVARLEAMADMTRKSKTVERLPEAFRDYVKELKKERGAVQNVYVPVEKWNEILGEAGLDPAQEADNILGGPEQYQQLIEEGGKGDLVIPIEQYLQKLARTPLHDKIVDNMRLYQGDLTHTELQAERESLKEMLQDTTGPIEVSKLSDEERAIYNQEYQEVLRVTGDQVYADAVGKIKARTIVRLAKRAGVDPIKHYKRYEVGLFGPIERATQGGLDFLKTPVGRAIRQYVPTPTTEAQKRVNDLVERLRDGDPDAIRTVAPEMAEQVSASDTLVPVPDASGNTGPNRKLAEEIARITGAQVADILTSTPRVPQAERRRRGISPARAEEIETRVRELLESEYVDEWLPNPKSDYNRLAYYFSRKGGINIREEETEWRENYKKIPGLASKTGDTFDGWGEHLAQVWPEHFHDREEAFEWLRDEWQFGDRRQRGVTEGTGAEAIREMDIQGAIRQVTDLVEEATHLGITVNADELTQAFINDQGWTEVSGDQVQPGQVFLVRDTGEIHQATRNEDGNLVLSDGTDLPVNDFTFYEVLPMGTAGPAPVSPAMPQPQNPVLIDNVRVSGATVASAQTALPGARYLVWAQAGEDAQAEAPQGDVAVAAAQETNRFVRWYQRGFHGSPYTFEKFDITKVGTGEGAAAYGWGLYFSSHESIAKWYYENLVRLVHGTEIGLVDRPTYIPRIDANVWNEIQVGGVQNYLPPEQRDPGVITNSDYRDALFDMQGRFGWINTEKLTDAQARIKIQDEYTKTLNAQRKVLTRLEAQPSRKEIATKIAKVIEDAGVKVSDMVAGNVDLGGTFSDESVVIAEAARYAHGLLGRNTRNTPMLYMPRWMNEAQFELLQEIVPADLAQQFEDATRRDLDMRQAEHYRRLSAVALEMLEDPHFKLRVDLVKPEGQVVAAELPEPHELLDWEKPLVEQPEILQTIEENEDLWPIRMYNAGMSFDTEEIARGVASDPERMGLTKFKVQRIVTQGQERWIVRSPEMLLPDKTLKRPILEGGDVTVATKAKILIRGGLSQDPRTFSGRDFYDYWTYQSPLLQGLMSEAAVKAGLELPPPGDMFAQERASKYLLGFGIPGHSYMGGTSGETNFVMYTDQRISDVTRLYQAEEVEGRGPNTPQFRAWFGKSQVVDQDGRPKVVYHGTTHTFTKFSKERGNLENQFGRNFYFTDGKEDVGINYAGEGPDLTQRITMRAEQIANERGVEYDDPEAYKQAREELVGDHAGAVMPVYLALQNPANLDTGYFTADISYDEYLTDFQEEAIARVAELEGVEPSEISLEDDRDAIMEQVRELADENYYEPEISGTGPKFLEALDRVATRYDDVQGVPSQWLMEEGFEPGLEGASMGDVENALRGGSTRRGQQAGGESPLIYAMDPETGELAMSQIIAEAFEEAGFDGIIHSAERFGVSAERPRGMEGVSGVTHYVAFKPHQIKSAIGNKGAFDPLDPDIRAQGKKGYIEFKPGGRRFDIHLLETADPSTLFHETAHFFLEMLGDLAYTDGASQEIVGDYETVLGFLGVKSRDLVGEKEHEKFARAYEQYLREGAAPSEELRGVFAKIKAWMMRVYGQVKDLVTLTPEIRGVFDRMLASEEEIAAQAAKLKFEPIEAIRESMTDAERAEYDKVARAAAQQGEDELRAALMADEGEVRDWWKERYDSTRAETEEEFRKTRGMQALHFLQKGRYIGGDELPGALLTEEPKPRPLKLDAEILVERYGPDILKQLPGWKGQYVYGRNRKGRNPRAADPEDLAPLLGFADGDALVDFLKGRESYDQAFQEAMDRKLQSRHGDLLKDRSRLVQRAAEAAASEARIEQLLIEVRYLRRQLRPGAAENRRRPFTHGELKVNAERQIAAKRLVDNQPHVFMRNAQKHGNAAFRFAESGNIARAYDEKVRQLWNMALYRASRDARKESDAALRYFRRMIKQPAQARLGLAGPEYRNQVNALLEQYELAPATMRQVGERQALRDFIQHQESLGLDVVIDESLRRRSQMHYTELSVRDMRNLRDAIRNIDGIARQVRNAQADADRAEFMIRKEGLIGSLQAHIPDHGKYDPLTEGGFGTWKEGLREWISWADSRLLRLEEVIDRNDGRRIDGPWRTHIWNPIADAQALESDYTKRYALKLTEVYEKLPAAQRRDMLQKKVEIKGLGGRRIPLQACIAVALNWGNEGNRQRLLEGGAGLMNPLDPRWESVVQEMLSKLDPEHWRFVQRIWDTIGGLWPEIEAMEERLTGIPPERVQPLEIIREFEDGTSLRLKGGYFPIVYADIAGVAEKASEAGDATDVLNHPAYVRAMTAHGHVYKRVKKLNKPIRLDLGIIPRHLQQVIHDLTHREAIIGVYKLLNDSDVRAAMYDQLGKERHKVFNIWLRRIAADRMTDDPRMERFFREARMNATVVAMGAKATVITQNFSNFLNVLEPGRGVKGRYLARAMREFYAHPVKSTEWIHEKSGEMRHRFNNLERDIRHGIEATLREVQLTPLKKARHLAQRFGFGLISASDKLSAYPAWMGAYHQARAEGMTEELSVRHADRVIRTVLTSGAPKDIAAIQGGGELNRSLTMFYSWFSAAYMRFRALQFDIRTARHREEGIRAGALPYYIARMFAFWFVPAMFAEMLANRGWWEDDDESALEWMLTKTLMYPAMTVPGLRDIAGFYESRKKGYQRSIKYVPLGRILEEGAKASAVLIEEVGDLVFDPREFEADRAGKAATRLMGHVFGLPSSQFEITAGYLWDVVFEDEEPEDILEFFQHLLFYRKPEERD